MNKPVKGGWYEHKGVWSLWRHRGRPSVLTLERVSEVAPTSDDQFVIRGAGMTDQMIKILMVGRPLLRESSLTSHVPGNLLSWFLQDQQSHWVYHYWLCQMELAGERWGL